MEAHVVVIFGVVNYCIAHVVRGRGAPAIVTIHRIAIITIHRTAVISIHRIAIITSHSGRGAPGLRQREPARRVCCDVMCNNNTLYVRICIYIYIYV